jgi:hypothetical protein
MKRLYFILVCCLFCVATAAAQSGRDGNISWSIKNDTLTISGTDTMPDYFLDDLDDSLVTTAPWRFYLNSFTVIDIKSDVTSVGNFAFAGCRGLKSITIPNSVTSIGYNAFDNCHSLTSITIPNSITSINLFAFADCSSLTSIIIPDSVTSIGILAFSGCLNLTSVTIPKSTISIGAFAFTACNNLTEIINNATIPQMIDDVVFANTNITKCTLRVPAEAIAAYHAAEVWKNFGNIEAIKK